MSGIAWHDLRAPELRALAEAEGIAEARLQEALWQT